MQFDQHFMVDEEILGKISQLVQGDVIEIGPGRGALTKYLVKKGTVTAVEKDPELCVYLRKTMKVEYFSEKLIIYNQDALDFELKGTIVSNLPYGISESLFYKLINSQIDYAVLVTGINFLDLLKGENMLGIYAREFFEVEKQFDVPKSAFEPQPKVESVCFTLKKKKRTPLGQLLAQRDKKLKNAIVETLARNSTKKGAKAKLSELNIEEDLLDKKLMYMSNEQFKHVWDKLPKI